MINIGTHPQILKALLPYLVEKRFVDILEIVEELPYGDMLVELLTVLVPHLSEEQCAMVLEVIFPSHTQKRLFESFTHFIWESRQQVRILAILTPHLSEERASFIIPTLLQAARELSGEEARAWILMKLASHIPQALLKKMLDTTWSLMMGQYRMQVLKVLLPTLSQAAWIEVLELVNAKIHATEDANYALEVLNAASPITQVNSSMILYSVLHEVLRLLSQRERQETLLDLSLLAPGIRLSGNEKAITESCSAVLEVGYWWP